MSSTTMPPEERRMKRAVIPILVLVALSMLAHFVAPPASSFPPPPSSKTPTRPEAAQEGKAWDLYVLARIENPRLVWDQCLANKALLRARQLVVKNYFDHKDPATGKNSVWKMVERCYRPKCAGENLIRGMNTPEHIHDDLMASPLHRKNIVDKRFSKVGIACYDYICVQLFVGL